jgi:hypothetical protein
MFRHGREVNLTPNYIVLILLAGFALGPLLVLGFNALKSPAELGRNPLGPPLAPSGRTSRPPGSWEILPPPRPTA